MFTVLLCFVALCTAVIGEKFWGCDRLQYECDDGDCISVLERCDGQFDCDDRSDENDCFNFDYPTETDKFYDKCDDLDAFKCTDTYCISPEKHCDGNTDCSNGRDEDHCDFRSLSSYLYSSKTKAIQWMRFQYNANWGWKENTNRAVVALHLAGDANFDGSNKDDFIAKQLELEVATYLLRRQSDNASSAADLAMYINALLVICHDPRNFYGYDLISYLKKDLETESLFAPPFPYLTLCNAKEPISKVSVDLLLDILDYNASYHGFVLELQSLAIMALSCINSNGSTSEYLEQKIAEAVNNLKQEQMEDGSFGNKYTTALVLQALMASNQSATDWNVKSSIQYLSENQYVNGSYGNFLITYLIMPVLNAKSLLDIGKIKCSNSFNRSRNGDIVSDLKSRLGKKVIVKYSLFVGNEKDQIHPMVLRIPANITVFELMSLAADIDPKYNFKTHEIKKKKYIYEISDIPNDPENSKFWLIYLRISNETFVVAEQSPDKIHVREKDDIIMWYKTLDTL